MSRPLSLDRGISVFDFVSLALLGARTRMLAGVFLFLTSVSPIKRSPARSLVLTRAIMMILDCPVASCWYYESEMADATPCDDVWLTVTSNTGPRRSHRLPDD